MRRAHLVAGLAYPIWYALTPSEARDAWWTWAGVSLAFVGSALAASSAPTIQRQLRNMFPGPWLSTLQMYALAFLNDMNVFYTVGSVMAVLAVTAMIATQRGLAAYGVFVFVLGGSLFLADPDPIKAACWGGLLPVLVIAFLRLRLNVREARVADQYRNRLERDVAAQTSELSEANRKLVAEIEERERLESQLLFAQKMEAVGLMAGGVAHEFNNLLTTIRIYADTLHEGLATPSEQREDVTQIQNAARQASTLTHQLLTVSRRGTTSVDVLDLNRVIRDTAPVLRRLLGESSTLVLDLEEGTQPIRANRDQIEQAMVNLTLNARDAMPEGGEFRVQTRTQHRSELTDPEPKRDLDAEEYVLLAVEDTGIGMDEETRRRAFDPFFTRKPVDEGTGLGLSMVYGIVTQGDGLVRLVSQPGLGARLELHWPRAEVPAVGKPDIPTVGPQGGCEYILLVENEEALRRALRRGLLDAGYGVVDVADGTTALALATRRHRPFDLVLSDVVMPGLSGLELAHELIDRKLPLKVILVSGQLGHPSLRERELPEGVTLLPKPFSLDELTKKVRSVLDA